MSSNLSKENRLGGAGTMKIVVVNVGSTSLKSKLFSFVGDNYISESVVAEVKIEGIGLPESAYSFSTSNGITDKGTRFFPDYGAGIQAMIAFLTNPAHRILNSLDELNAVAFKTVHCGYVPDRAVLLDDVVLQRMEEFIPVAPAHNPPYIRAIKTFRDLLPDKPLVGLFEPTFHRFKPPVAEYYGLPNEYHDTHGVKRYGFHGASLWYISERAPRILERSPEGLRIIACHLGGSSSVCAIKDGKSIDTSMGFSPQSGIIQSTRPDDLDPFAVLYLMKKLGWSVDDAIKFLAKECGLKGVSGLGSGEFKIIEQEASRGHEQARRAVDLFLYGVLKYIGAYAAVLGGVDILAFSGGIGERSPLVRERLCDSLRFLGVSIDKDYNKKISGIEACISDESSMVDVLVVPTNEEFIVAREAAQLLRSTGTF